MSDQNTLADELRGRREALGVTAEDVGRRCGIAPELLRDWERGAGQPPVEAMRRWADALGLRLALVDARGAAAGLRIDWERRQVTVDGAPVRLTPMEWRALERLAWAPGELVTHEELFRHLYGADRDYQAQSTAVRVLITKLRRILPLKIEAQWRRGYVVTGVEPSQPRPLAETGVPDERTRPGGAAISPHAPARTGLASYRARNPVPEAARDNGPVLAFTSPGVRQIAPPASSAGLRRREELSVIERFLAERGATRCPDVATIQHQPLPTLVWDKVKRKWVRPSIQTVQAS